MRVLIAGAMALGMLIGCANQAGLDAMNRGDLQAAEREFSAAAQRGDSGGFNNLGVIAQRRNERDKAIAYYTVAARMGNGQAIQNLINLGAPVPAPDLAAASAQQRANEAAAMNQASQYFLNRSRPMPLPQQTNCRTVYSGNVANTQCY